MFRRSVRITCLLIGLLATAGVAYRILHDEDVLGRERQRAAAGQAAISQASELLLDVRASLHAYVAAGQGLPFWANRAQETIDRLRQSLVELDKMVTPTGGSLDGSLDSLDQLAAAESRARSHVSRDELRLASDVIFTEVRDILAAASADVQSVRDRFMRQHDRRAESIRQEQVMLAGAGLAVWIAIALLLLPTEPQPAVKDPGQWRSELKESLKKPIPVTPETLVAAAPVPAEPPKAVVPLADLKEVSEICADLSALTGPGALEGALSRVSTVLNATGLIVWIASNDNSTLSPVATNGFDPKLVARIGRIGRESSNLTAAAFRDNAAKISPVTATAPGALAVPMCSPTGPAGVLSVELKAGQAVDEAKVALSAILAAQLATLAMPIQQPASAVESADPLRSAI
jgi:hypothetical protein